MFLRNFFSKTETGPFISFLPSDSNLIDISYDFRLHEIYKLDTYHINGNIELNF